jgi:putative spermidine/putrescine transport system permease protein
MVTTLFWLVLALQFVSPTQIVARAKQQQAA